VRTISVVVTFLVTGPVYITRYLMVWLTKVVWGRRCFVFLMTVLCLVTFIGLITVFFIMYGTSLHTVFLIFRHMSSAWMWQYSCL
jgi:hypothetical protein